jgi:PEGA domain
MGEQHTGPRVKPEIRDSRRLAIKLHAKMLSKRVIVVAGDKALQKRLIAAAMAAGGAVQAFSSIDELSGRFDAELFLYALTQANEPGFVSLTAKLPDGARLVPIIPAANLELMVKLLGDGRIASVLAADEISTATLAASISKLLYGDLFGLEKVMTWGVRVYSSLVGDYNEKSMAIASVGDFAQAMGVRRKYREQIDQCIDEMLMNALYDAPVDGDGNPLFADVPVRERVLLKSNEKAVLQYACDGDRFAVSVRDSFGSLKKSTVLAYLDKCLHATGAEQIDRKAGGAGLGLYLIANAATEIYFHIFEGSATEVVCTFDLAAPRSQLRALGLFEESIDTAARPPPSNKDQTRTIQSRRGRRLEDLAPPPRSSPLLPVMMVFSILLLVGAVALAALPYIKTTPQAALAIESDPPGANVFVDGRKRGTAPLRVDGLEAGRSYAVRATLTGRKDDDQLISAAVGESMVRLKLVELPGRVAVESDPPGAKLILDGKDTGKLTPAELDLVPGSTAEVTLKKDGFSEQHISVTCPQAGEHAVYRGNLPLSPLVAALTVESDPPSANVTVDGLALLPPAPIHDTFLKPGTKHLVRVSAPGFIELKEELLLGSGEHKTLHAKLVEGGVLSVKSNLVARVLVDGHLVATGTTAQLALAEGKHALALHGQKPFLRYEATVTVEKGRTLDKSVSFGTVELKAPGVTAHPSGADSKGVTELALPAGPQKLTLTNKDGEQRDRDLVVEPGGKVVIDTW